jgi:hypothetical protein
MPVESPESEIRQRNVSDANISLDQIQLDPDVPNEDLQEFLDEFSENIEL